MSVPATAAVGPYDPFFAAPATVADFGATTRPFGIAAGDYDEDGDTDMVVGRTTGNVAFVAGNGDGTFAAPVAFAWKQAFFNGWAFAPGDLNGDGNLDVVWGANAASTGCSVSPVPSTGCPSTVTVNDGDVRVWYGNGDGTFQESTYFVSGVRHNAGVLLADIGTDAGSVAVADIDGDSDADVVAGATEGVKILRNGGGGSFTTEVVDTSGTYFPTTSTQNSPWGLAFGDADADGDIDLWVGDRALYVYLFRNDGAGAWSITPGNIPGLETRPNVYLRHDSNRAAVGYTPSLASADVNGDDRADLFLGLHSGTQTPASNVANDGLVLLDVSKDGAHSAFGSLGDLGTMARGLQTADVNGDGATDVLGAVYEGQVKLLRQLPPVDIDGDGVSDYVDNAPEHPNAARLDMNTDGATTYLDQLDNDFDTVLGDPEVAATWQRLGDPADPDDDNDGIEDEADNCVFTANPDQADKDGDGRGDACDPRFDVDADGDGVPAFDPDDPLYAAAQAAAARWASGDTHFVIRIDALGRIFQNEFTQLLTDAATLTPEQWELKCWENYGAGDPADPCGTGEGTEAQDLALDGGRDLPVSLVTIPKQLWTDAPVIDWVNDRNDSPNLDLAMHAAYHVSNTARGDWAELTDRNFYSCETCGLTLAENVELLGVGKDTLLGNYTNKWLTESGALSSSPKIDWTTAANPLLSYAPPFNADDTTAREAVSLLGFKAHSSSVFEENSTTIFTPEGSHHETFDQFGVFHTSADVELDPPVTTDGTYDPEAYADFLASETEDGGLNTWLIEEVEWSGRPCNDQARVGPNFSNVTPTCAEAGGATTNRENNTVYQPRWDAWLQLLDHVKNYEGGVAMTMAEVALAKAFDNAPTVANPDQADSDANGVGDVVDGAAVVADDVSLSRNVEGSLTATLANGGTPLPDQAVTFTFDADGDSTDETYLDTTDADGVATVAVTATRPVGSASFTAAWDGGTATSSDVGSVSVADATTTTLDPDNPATGQVTDAVTVGATLTDTDDMPVAGAELTFTIGAASVSGTTDGAGHATATLTLVGPAGASTLTAAFAGDANFGPSSDQAPFTVAKEDTTLTPGTTTSGPMGSRVVTATLSATDDAAALAGKTVVAEVQKKVKGAFVTEVIATGVTDAQGVVHLTVASKYLSKAPRPVTVRFAGDADFLGTAIVVNVSR